MWQCRLRTISTKLFTRPVFMCSLLMAGGYEFTYHGVASVITEDHNIDGRGVIGHTDPSLLGSVFSVGSSEWEGDKGLNIIPHVSYFWASLDGEVCFHSLVVIVNSCRETPGTDPVAHQMHPLTQPGLNPVNIITTNNPWEVHWKGKHRKCDHHWVSLGCLVITSR